MEFRVIALDTKLADEVRSSGKAPKYGHPTHTELASGYGPCRHCLRTFKIGEENRILFTYDAFHGVETIPLPGPVFIHETPCGRYNENSGYPADMEPYAVVLNAFSKGQTLVARQVVAAQHDKSAPVIGLLDRPDVDYIEVRDATAGCFDFRIERIEVVEHRIAGDAGVIP